jgi:hypothetical protein
MLLFAAVFAAAASAKPRWNEGKMERSTVQSCASVVAGQPVLTAGILAHAGFRADPKALPRVGQTFYGRAFIGGAGDPCVTQMAKLELVLPAGVRLAITRATPIRCTSITPDTSSAVSSAEGCPRSPIRGTYGPWLARTNRQDGLWELPRGQGYLIDFPLRSTRTLKGIARGVPACARPAFGPPCPAAKARDYLQVAVHVADGNTNPWVVPVVGLFVRR